MDSRLRLSQCREMLKHEAIREELIRQLDAKEIKGKDVAAALGIDPARVTEMRKYERRVQAEEEEPLARLLRMDDHLPSPTVKAEAASRGLAEFAAELGLVLVDEIDLAFGMGATFLDGGEPEVMGIVPFRENWLHGLYSGDVKHLKVVRGRGDSMEPTIRDGDTVLVDTSQRRIDDQDRIWAISYGDLGMIRRIRVTPRGSLMLMPDNQVVRPDEVGDGETAVIGRVIWIGRRI